ncbi:thioesterase II family protein [Xenorhabdus innexi]|uniref:Thioesterase n=1 Tax=Xenorhabdus innexi TaxID=290109 RepID=A0A1N6MUJ8_9GAMM|nr:thioesterase domain-containing protein [Xenorhabdus innexi]PHM30069.1 thioesterase [Xenorhabdus innexi]SIP72490.1 putative Microcystin synthetase-associated thioesterase [Xenorhabdus innexi]
MSEQNILVCFPYAGGNKDSFDIVKKHLSKGVRIISMNYSSSAFLLMSKNSTTFFKVFLEKIEAQLKAQLKEFEEKITFFGHSIGAIIAYELAILCGNRLNIHKLVVSACKPPELLVKSTIFSSGDNAFENIVRLGGLPTVVLNNPTRLKKEKYKIISDLRILSYYDRVIYPRINCEIHALSAKKDFLASEDDMKLWSNYTNKKFRENTFDGDHFYFREKSQEVAKIIS